MAGKQVSALAQFDDMCRGFNYFINSSDKGTRKDAQIF